MTWAPALDRAAARRLVGRVVFRLRHAGAPTRPRLARRLRAKDGTPPCGRAAALPPTVSILDIQIHPAVEPSPKTAEQAGANWFGGPVWPEALADSPLRFRTRGFVGDRMLDPVAAPEAVIDRPCVWGGYLHPHFGHLVAEHLGRLTWSRRAWPGLPLAFTAHPNLNPRRLPPHILDVLAWHGIRPSSIHVVKAPTLVRELLVAPQAEVYRTDAPSPAYLDLLDDHLARSRLEPVPSDLLYVTRAGILRTLRGGHVGEGYLARLLTEAGARVIDPGAVPLRDQLAAYAGARRLVFAEGSALHGRQLLGRLDQRITVIMRRDRAGLARMNLLPRCRGLAYVAPNRAYMSPVMLPDWPTDAYELTLYDVPALHATFAGLGVDLAARWDPRAYREACDADLAAWRAALHARRRGPFDVPATLAALDRALAQRPFETA